MKEKKQKIYAIPLYAVMMAPFVVHGRLVDAGLSDFPWFSQQGKVFDLFLYDKKNAVLLVSCLILIFGAVMFLKGDFRVRFKKRFSVFAPLVIYVCLVFASSLISQYREYALNGMMEQYESIFVIAGYFLICVYAYMACCKEVFTAFGVFCCVIGGIGTLQLFGVDIYRTGFLQKLLVADGLGKLSFSITAETGRSYCSLSNPNYVGMLCCLTIPVLIMLTVCAGTWRRKGLYGLACVLMFLSLLGSRSKSGIAVLAFCVFLLAVLFRKDIAAGVKLRQRYVNAAIVCVLFVMCIAVCVLVYRWGELWGYNDHADTGIREIVTMDDGVKMNHRGKKMFFHVDENGTSLGEALTVVDENGTAYDMLEKEGKLSFEEKTLSEFTAALVQYGSYVALEIWDGNFFWYFTNRYEDNTWYYLTCYGRPDKLDSSTIAVSEWLEGKERIANGRGYIWSRTIPLLKENILLGSGQDSFTVVFPNNDYLGKARWGYKDMLITKPHCMYLQIAVQSGVVSLIALFAFWGFFLLQGFTKKSKDVNGVILKAIAVGVTGYLFMGITNDSSVGVAPVFWLIIGMGLRMC